MRRKRRFRRLSHRLQGHMDLRIVWLFILCLACTAAILAAELKLRPLVRTYAEGRAGYIAARSVNQAVQEELEQAGGIYDNLVFFEKNEAGDILAVKTDSIRINRLKSAILDRVAEKLSQSGTTRIEVPLGNIINGELFSGRGPKIPIVLQLVNTANANFISEFNEAGINQTRHRLLIEIDTAVTALLPAGRTSFRITSQINLAETIIVGRVPDSYTDIVDTDSSLLEKYNDYAN